MYRVPRHQARHTPTIGRQHMFGNAHIEVNSCHSSMNDQTSWEVQFSEKRISAGLFPSLDLIN